MQNMFTKFPIIYYGMTTSISKKWVANYTTGSLATLSTQMALQCKTWSNRHLHKSTKISLSELLMGRNYASLTLSSSWEGFMQNTPPVTHSIQSFHYHHGNNSCKTRHQLYSWGGLTIFPLSSCMDGFMQKSKRVSFLCDWLWISSPFAGVLFGYVPHQL